MNIVILQDYLRCGGTEQQTLFLADAFARASNQTHVITFRPGGDLSCRLERSPAHVASLQKRDLGLDWFAPRLRKALQTIQPDIILCMGRMANSYGEWAQRALPGSRVVSTFRTGKNLPWPYRRSLMRTSAVAANSRYAKKRLLRDYRVPEANLEIIVNSLTRPIDSGKKPRDRAAVRERYGAGKKTCVFLCAAMFRPEKNQIELLQTARALNLDFDWQLWLIGSGRTENKCRQWVDSLPTREDRERFRFFGLVDDVVPFYHAADVAVTASRRESLPNFLVEAQIAALPVVANDVGGAGEAFLPGISGFLIPPDSRTARHTYMEILLRDEKLRREMGAAGAAWARNEFDPARQAERYLALFNRLIHHYPRFRDQDF